MTRLVTAVFLSFIDPNLPHVYDCDVLAITVVHHSNVWAMRYLMWYDYIPAERAYVLRACITASDTKPHYHDGKWTVLLHLSNSPVIIIRATDLHYTELLSDPEPADLRRYGGTYRWVFRPSLSRPFPPRN